MRIIKITQKICQLRFQTQLLLSLLFVQGSVCNLAGQMDFDNLFSTEIEDDLAKGQLRASSASYHYTFIGNYPAAMMTYDIPVSWGVDTVDMEKVNELKLADAKTHILDLASQHRVVIFAESHLKPQHRLFVRTLLEDLKDLGYNLFALETLSPDPENPNGLIDIELNKRKYALNSTITGYYTREPQMSNLVRDALSLDFEVLGYERSYDNPDDKDRDVIQAENLWNHIKDRPESKMIVLCGWHHAVESNQIKRPGVHWMAHNFKNLSTIDPLTIYMDNFTEKISESQHPILPKLQIEVPSVFLNEDGKATSFSEQVDIEVAFPMTTYKKGRPTWLSAMGNKLVFIDTNQITLSYPVLIEAFFGDEKDGVPYDVVEMKHRYDFKPLYLQKGIYRIAIRNLGGELDEIEHIVD